MTDRLERWAATLRATHRWDPPAVPTVVVAPHPDDEVLMAGGLISRQRARGVAVTVLAVTDGDAAYPGAVDGRVLGAIRAREQAAALAALGVPGGDIVRLGIPDGAVAEHEDRLAEAIAALAARHEILVAPWEGDHHADHEACGRAARRGARAVGVPLVQGLFWTWHHRSPEALEDLDLLSLELDPDERATRDAAMACHASQVADAVVQIPLLDADDLAPLGWSAEHFVDRRDD
ncbi:hypothetical protein BH23ACT9_BH23ACT9_11600 [soil metagenome]